MRTHPPTLLTLARRAIERDELIPRGARVLVAVSGGPDSMALLHVLARLGAKLDFSVVAHGVDHGLRPDARIELDAAAAFADSLGVPFRRTEASVPTGGNLQARARSTRLAALRAAARDAGCSRIATGHHADDRAETLLLRILRGASADGLAVLPSRRGPLVRPFLRATRVDIEAHIARHDIPVASDPSNAAPRFLRARVRHELLPLLARLSPGIVGHLNALADELLARRAPRPDDEGSTYIPPFPRATRLALAALVDSGSRTARVELPRGLVVSFAPRRPK